ncbi:MAG: ubiquinone biosynthesis regulatory protein kinase UbiB [Gammaproteobacteria bacterium]|nr:ubiquinone biosynthesis regulatory protein kinase UbiB [Gammaproteobacteria bacterium]MDH5653533.1 ubiquinone biosynthesis regulatory protein kinase UbiB [Gammaproteobacteria bacterium]
MRRLGDFFRLIYVSQVLICHRIDKLIPTNQLPFSARLWLFLLLLPFRLLRLIGFCWLLTRGRSERSRAQQIRRSLEDLGPIFVKFGQILSTRRDLLPDDIAEELAKLQDQVPPFAAAEAKQIITRAFGQAPEAIFKTFSAEPFASASIAQVHGATLQDGTEVVVKVVRPAIRPVIQRDVSLLYLIAGTLHKYTAVGKQLRAVDLVVEFEKTILDELDLTREAANASQLRRNFLLSDKLYVPEVFWEYSRRDVLVMERIKGIPVGDIDGLRAAGVDLKALSDKGVEIFFTQVFRDSFFHADMHPGNIFVSAKGSYIAVDFGIMGTLTPTDQRYLAENFLAFFNRDYHRVAQLHIDSGWVAKDTRVDEFEAAIRTVCEPIFDKPLKEISFGQLLLRLFETGRRFNMQVQPQLLLLDKTLLNIEGLGRQLNPDLDLWKTAKPFLERWMSEQIGPRAMYRHLRENVPLWAERLPQIPNMIFDVLKQARNGGLQMQLDEAQLTEIKNEIRRNSRRNYAAIIGTGLLLTSAVFTTLETTATYAGIPIAAWICGIAGTIILLVNRPRKPH